MDEEDAGEDGESEGDGEFIDDPEVEQEAKGTLQTYIALPVQT